MSERAPPSGLRATLGEVGGTRVLVLSWPDGTADPLDLLTPAERDVVGLLMLGHGQAAIAQLRGTSLHTVRKQIEVIYDKLGVGSRGELASRLGVV